MRRRRSRARRAALGSPGSRARTWSARYRGGFARDGRRDAARRAVPGSGGAARAPAASSSASACSTRSRRRSHEGEIDDRAARRWTSSRSATSSASRRCRCVGAARVAPRAIALLGKAAPRRLRARDGDASCSSASTVPVTVALHPGTQRDRAEVPDRRASAELDFGNRVLQWVSDKLGGDAFATRLAREQIDDVARHRRSQPPPPFELSAGRRSRSRTATDRSRSSRAATARCRSRSRSAACRRRRRSCRRGSRSGARPRPRADTHARARSRPRRAQRAALRAVAHRLPRSTGSPSAGLDRRFNTDPIVTEFLVAPDLAAAPRAAAGDLAATGAGAAPRRRCARRDRATARAHDRPRLGRPRLRVRGPARTASSDRRRSRRARAVVRAHADHARALLRRPRQRDPRPRRASFTAR